MADEGAEGASPSSPFLPAQLSLESPTMRGLHGIHWQRLHANSIACEVLDLELLPLRAMQAAHWETLLSKHFARSGGLSRRGGERGLKFLLAKTPRPSAFDHIWLNWSVNGQPGLMQSEVAAHG